MHDYIVCTRDVSPPGLRGAPAHASSSSPNISINIESNNNGGVLGGISTGQDLVVRVAIKPTSSIRIPRQTLTKDLQETEVVTKGRHDPCVGIRGVPVAEAMAALVLADHKLRAAAYG